MVIIYIVKMVNISQRNILLKSGFFFLALVLANGHDSNEFQDEPPPEFQEQDESIPIARLFVNDRFKPMVQWEVTFTKQDVDKFQQCMCRSDNSECNIFVNGGVVVKQRGTTSKHGNILICTASDGPKIHCTVGLNPPPPGSRPPTINVFGDQCPQGNVALYWNDTQNANFSVKESYDSSTLQCNGGKCVDTGDQDRRDGHGISPTIIALIAVSVFLFILSVIVIFLCLIKTKKLRLKRNANHQKAGIEHPEKETTNEKSKLPPICSVYSNNPDGGTFVPSAPQSQKGMFNEEGLGNAFQNPSGFPLLVWPMDTRFRAPDYEANPPPYHTIFKPEYVISEEIKQNQDVPVGLSTQPIAESGNETLKNPQLKKNKRRVFVDISV